MPATRQLNGKLLLSCRNSKPSMSSYPALERVRSGSGQTVYSFAVAFWERAYPTRTTILIDSVMDLTVQGQKSELVCKADVTMRLFLRSINPESLRCFPMVLARQLNAFMRVRESSKLEEHNNF